MSVHGLNPGLHQIYLNLQRYQDFLQYSQALSLRSQMYYVRICLVYCIEFPWLLVIGKQLGIKGIYWKAYYIHTRKARVRPLSGTTRARTWMPLECSVFFLSSSLHLGLVLSDQFSLHSRVHGCWQLACPVSSPPERDCSYCLDFSVEYLGEGL